MTHKAIAYIPLFWVATSTVVSLAWGADQSRVDALNRCTSILEERTGALVTRDWAHLQRLANQFLATCKGVVDAEEYSNAFVHVAIANLQLNNIRAALTASDSCIATYYANSECHIERLNALIADGRMAEARKAFSNAERLVEHSLEKTERALRDAANAIDRNLHTARLRNLNSQKSLLSALKHRYFSQ